MGVFVKRAEGSKHPEVCAPQTVTCRIGMEESSATLSSLLSALKKSNSSEASATDTIPDHDEINIAEVKNSGVVLAGLHACGDLSATMLRLVTCILQSVDCKADPLDFKDQGYTIKSLSSTLVRSFLISFISRLIFLDHLSCTVVMWLRVPNVL